MEIEEIKTFEDLSEFLEEDASVLKSILQQRDSYIKKIRVPKKNWAGFREISGVQDDELRGLLRILRKRIESKTSFPDCVQGFVRGKSIITNARHHLGKKFVVNADIEDFFTSIKRDSVKNVFLALGFVEEHANLLADLTTVEGVLPMGFPTSPILANIACGKLDIDLDALAKQKDAEYTRYSDDISISGNRDCPTYEEIETILNKHGFQMNRKKFRIQKKGGNQYVTGLTVCDPAQPHISKKLKRRLRLEIYYLKKYGTENSLEYYVKNNKGQRRILFDLGDTFVGWMYYISSIDRNFTNWAIRTVNGKAKG